MRLVPLVVIALAIVARTAAADGIPFDGDRVKDMKTTVLALTEEQLKALEGQYEVADDQEGRIRAVLLSPEQKATLEKDSGIVMNEIDVWLLKDAKGTCTCELSNIAIRFTRMQIEVPHDYLSGPVAKPKAPPAENPSGSLTRNKTSRLIVLGVAVSLVGLAIVVLVRTLRPAA